MWPTTVAYMDSTAEYNYTDYNDLGEIFTHPTIQPIQIVSLVCYSLVILLGVPGNVIVVWATGFCIRWSVNSLWFLNLAVADLLCTLSLPLLMVPLAHDDHWHFGPLACTLVKGIFHLVMYCSVFQLVVISLDRWLMVSRPVWCQNHRRAKKAVYICAAVWLLALLVSVPQFIFTKEIEAGEEKRECLLVYSVTEAWVITSARFTLGFLLPFLIIVSCHLVVYQRALGGLARNRSQSKRTGKVITAVVLSFFLCWIPLHITDFLILKIPRSSSYRPTIYITHVLTLCLAYFNSCLNPLLYVCLGRGFKEGMSRSLRGFLNFITEDQSTRANSMMNDTKSSSNGKTMTNV